MTRLTDLDAGGVTQLEALAALHVIQIDIDKRDLLPELPGRDSITSVLHPEQPFARKQIDLTLGVMTGLPVSFDAMPCNQVRLLHRNANEALGATTPVFAIGRLVNDAVDGSHSRARRKFLFLRASHAVNALDVCLAQGRAQVGIDTQLRLGQLQANMTSEMLPSRAIFQG